VKLFLFILLLSLVFLLAAKDLFFTSSGELQPWSFQLCLLLSLVSSLAVTFSHLSGCVLLLFMLPVFVFVLSFWLCARIWVTSSVFSSSSTILFSAESDWLFHTSPELYLFPWLYFLYLEFLSDSFSKSAFYFSGPFLYALCYYFCVIHHTSWIDSHIFFSPHSPPHSPALCNESGSAFLPYKFIHLFCPSCIWLMLLIKCSRAEGSQGRSVQVRE